MQKKNDSHSIAVFVSLLRIYTTLVCGVSQWQGFIKKRTKQSLSENESATTKGSTSVGKSVLILLLFVYLIGCCIAVVRMITLGLYRVLQPLGMQQLLFEIEMTVLCVFLFISNFLLTLSTYYVDGIESMLLALPIPPRIFFGTKFLAHCLPAAALSLFFFLTSASVYGYYEHSPLSFYIMACIGALWFPLPIVTLCYLINISIMRTTKMLKNKHLVMMIGGVSGIILAVGINYFINTINMFQDSTDVQNFLAPYRQGFTTFTQILLPIRFFAASLAADSFSTGCIPFLAFIALASAIPCILISLFSALYVKTLDGFDEHTLKRLNTHDAKKLIRSGFNRHAVFLTLLTREIHSMNREPIYLLNGPLTILVLPLFWCIMYWTGSLQIPPSAIAAAQQGPAILIAGICAAFLGSANNIAATALSRDAKNLHLIKSLPISITCYMQAKLAHAMLFAAIGTLIGVGLSAVFFSLTFSVCAQALIIALSLALFFNLLALLLDTIHPKLQWDSPAAAVKHNLNAFIMMFSDLLLLSVTLVAALFISLPQQYYLVCFAALPLIASALIAHFLWPLAEKKIHTLEL